MSNNSDGYFEASYCSFWLKQGSHVFADGINSIDDAKREQIMAIVTFVVTSVLYLIYLAETWKLKKKMGYSHLLLLIWLIVQIAPLFTTQFQFTSTQLVVEAKKEY